MPRGDQLIRQWCLLQVLENRVGQTVEALAAELKCSVRTVWRDLRILQAVGFPLTDLRDGKRSRWQFVEGYRSKLPVPFTLTELLALHWGRDLLVPFRGTPVRDALGSALEKIRSLLPPQAIAYLEAMGEVVSVRGVRMKLALGGQDWLTPLHEAIRRQERIEIDHYSMSRNALTTRQIDPYHLTYFEGGFYLVAHCHLRAAPRTFAVERIRAIRPSGLHFVGPRDFDPEAFFHDCWGIIQGDRTTVRLQFSREQGRYVAERLWHPSQEFRWLSDGRLELTLKVADTLDLKRWILSYGREVGVVEPGALREEIRQEAEAMLRKPAPRRRPTVPARRPPLAVTSSDKAGVYRRRAGSR